MPSLRVAEHWLKGLAWLGWLAGVVLGLVFAGQLRPEAQVFLAGVWLVLLAVLLRHGWLRLFGPVLFYELMRLTRRRRNRWLRNGFAVALGLIFAHSYFLWVIENERHRGTPMPLNAQAELAHNFFVVYMVVQFMAVSLLTPGFVAGAIAEEKERRTLEFILATDLRNREIIFGKLSARVGNLLMILLAGLPVLSCVQFFGGVDPDQLLAGFAATLITMVSLSALSLCCSVLAKRARDAIALAYLVAIAYFAFALMAVGFQTLDEAKWSLTLFGQTVSLGDVAYAFSIGNPVVGLIEMAKGIRADSLILTQLLGQFALFHALFITGCLAWSVLCVRAVALRQSYGVVGSKEIELALRRRRELGDDPMYWKEVYVETGLKLGLLGRLFVLLIVLASFSFVFVIAYKTLWSDPLYYGVSRSQLFTEFMNGWARVAGTIVFCLLMLAIAIRGAGSIRGERDRQTFDDLLMTPLTSESIVWAKWWGCLLGMRKGWAWLGGIWLVGVVTGGIHVAMLPFLVIAALVFASASAWIGIWCSLTAATTLRATMKAILLSLFAGGGYMLIFVFACLLPVELLGRGGGGNNDIIEMLAQFFAGLSPLVDMAWLPIHESDDMNILKSPNGVSFAPFVFMGVLFWAGLSYLLSNLVLTKFREETNRLDSNRPRFGGENRPVPPNDESTEREGLVRE